MIQCFWKNIVWPQKVPNLRFFALIDLHPLYFDVGIVSAPHDHPPMSWNGKMCFLSILFGCPVKKINSKYRSTLKTLTLEILPNFCIISCCHYTILFWDFKTHHDGHNRRHRHQCLVDFLDAHRQKQWASLGVTFWGGEKKFRQKM